MDEDEAPEAPTQDQRPANVLGALRAWVLAEDAYTQGRVPDEVLTYLQDHIDRLLGPHATVAAGDRLRQHAESGGSLSDLARDRDALADLLELIEGKRRHGLELEWRAERSVGPDGSWRPEAVLVMAEHGVQDPVWDRPCGTGEPVLLGEVGVSQALAQRLRAWNALYERSALADTWTGSPSQAGWVQQGLVLASELQQELPDINVRYFHTDDDRPLRSL